MPSSLLIVFCLFFFLAADFVTRAFENDVKNPRERRAARAGLPKTKLWMMFFQQLIMTTCHWLVKLERHNRAIEKQNLERQQTDT